ncbi:MAG: OsmC family protein [Nitrosopumilus sp.]
MITGFREETKYAVKFSDGKHHGQSDTTAEKGGGESGFRPHGLLEAAYASCINMTIRMFANKHKIPLSGVTTQVTLHRDELSLSCCPVTAPTITNLL